MPKQPGFGTLTIELGDASQLADVMDALGGLERAPEMLFNEPAERSAASAKRVEVMSPQDNVQRLIRRGSILYGKALGDYVRIVSDEGRFLIRGRISQMERRWERHGFIRTHRAYVVNGARVRELRRNGNGTAFVGLSGGESVPVSRRRLARVHSRLLA